jgi:hypothetical protein
MFSSFYNRSSKSPPAAPNSATSTAVDVVDDLDIHIDLTEEDLNDPHLLVRFQPI